VTQLDEKIFPQPVSFPIQPPGMADDAAYSRDDPPATDSDTTRRELMAKTGRIGLGAVVASSFVWSAGSDTSAAVRTDPLSPSTGAPVAATTQAMVIAQSGAVQSVAPSSLSTSSTVTFDTVAGGSAPGTNYNGVLALDGVSAAERFVGQPIAVGSGFDTLSASASGPLRLQAGAANKNLCVFVNTNGNVLAGVSDVGFPSFDAIGEGSFAFLFGTDQSEIGFDVVGGDGGSATIIFFRRDATVIDTLVLGGLGQASYGFRRAAGASDIAGCSVHNDDPAGIGVDNLRFTSCKKPEFDTSWNDHGVRQSNNNCYNYSTDKRTDTFAQPGRGTGRSITVPLTCSEVGGAAISDGLRSRSDGNDDPDACCHTVALVLWPGSGGDYHWYRRDKDGTWSHKPGSTKATRLDNAGKRITDPRTADRGPYTVFCGFYSVCPHDITIG
jgi:hypothetical protein